MTGEATSAYPYARSAQHAAPDVPSAPVVFTVLDEPGAVQPQRAAIYRADDQTEQAEDGGKSTPSLDVFGAAFSGAGFSLDSDSDEDEGG